MDASWITTGDDVDDALDDNDDVEESDDVAVDVNIDHADGLVSFVDLDAVANVDRLA